MKQVLKLKKPLLINGANVTELEYDAEEITSQLFAEADNKKMQAASSKNGNMAGAVELDYSFHLYLGFAAIIAVDHKITMEDLERIKGHDLKEVMKIGRNFILRSEESEESDLEAQSETTQEHLTPQLES